MERMAFQKPLYRQPDSFDKPIACYSFLSILRASGIETTGRGEERREIRAIYAYQTQNNLFHIEKRLSFFLILIHERDEANE